MFNIFNKDKEKYNYFSYFEEISTLTYESTEIVLKNLKEYELSSLEDAEEKINEIESTASKKKDQMVEHLYEDFLPPIEREDIIDLAHGLDTALNNIKEIVIQLDMYQIKSIHPYMILLVELIEKTSLKSLNTIKEVKNFKHPKKLIAMNKEVIKLVREGNLIYYQGVKEIHTGKSDLLENYKHSRVYDFLQKSINSFGEVVNLVETIVLKNT